MGGFRLSELHFDILYSSIFVYSACIILIGTIRECTPGTFLRFQVYMIHFYV